MRSPQRLSSSVNGIRSDVAVVQLECFQYRQRLGRDDQLAVPYKPRPVLPVDLRSLLQQLFLGCGLMVCVKSIPFLPYLTLVKVTVVLDWDATKSLERMHLTGRQNAREPSWDGGAECRASRAIADLIDGSRETFGERGRK